jgi:acetyl esterase/lipase
MESLTKVLIGLIPPRTANAIRDSRAALGTIDVMGVLGMHYLMRLLASSPKHHNWLDVDYGDGTLLDVYQPHNPPFGLERSPVMVFFHGGAWGTGDKKMYSLLGNRFREAGFVAVIAGYPTYPDSDIDGQLASVQKTLEWVSGSIKQYGGDEQAIFLSGHSSGAHIGVTHLILAASRAATTTNVRGFVGLSGVYDIAVHYEFESARNVHEISPMKPALKGLNHFGAYSPTLLVEKLDKSAIRRIPPILLVHGDADATVPLSSAELFHNALAAAGAASSLEVLEGTDHMDYLVAAMLGWESRAIVQATAFCSACLSQQERHPRARL